MTARPRLRARLASESGKRKTAAAADDGASTPQQKLVRAAERGKFEALVRKAQPAEPVAMVTPEEREAELRAAGQWAEEKRAPEPVPEPAAPAEPPPEPPPRELTPNEQYIAEHCRWRRRGPGDYRERVPYGRCLTEYDPLTSELIGDGYDHGDEEDDEW